MADAIFESLGVRTAVLEDCYCARELPVTEDLIQRLGVVHGGIICAMIDDAIGRAMNVTLNLEREVALTAQLNVNFLSPVREGLLRAEGRILRRGATSAYGEADVFLVDDKGEPSLVARSTALLIRKAR